MSEPTLTDEQREAIRATMPVGDAGWHTLRYPMQTFATVAAMLADERAAREAAEAKVRDLTAGIGALVEEWQREELEDGNGFGAGRGRSADELRALVDDPAAALAEVRAEAWDEGRDEGQEDVSRVIRGDTLARNPYRAEAEGAGR